MTSPPGQDGHLDPGVLDGGGHVTDDALADRHGDLLAPADRVTAEAHLSSCARCADRAAALDELPRRLAAVAEVGPVPADVVASVDAALVAETVSEGATGARTVTPLSAAPRRSSPFGMRVLQAAAVVVLVLAGVGIAFSGLGGGGGGTDAGPTAARDASAGGRAVPESGSFPVTASGQNWSQDSLPVAVPSMVAGDLAPRADADQLRSSADSAAGDGAEAPEPQVAGLAGGPRLGECVAALAEGPATPLAVDLAEWEGNPAAVILLPTADDPETLDAWVVAPDCSTDDAKVLYFARLARP